MTSTRTDSIPIPAVRVQRCPRAYCEPGLTQAVAVVHRRDDRTGGKGAVRERADHERGPARFLEIPRQRVAPSIDGALRHL